MIEPRDLIAAFPDEQAAPELADMRATYRFVIEGVGSFLLRIEDGRPELLDGPADAETTFRCSAEDLEQVVLGGQNLLTAILQGRIEVDGDIARFFIFHRLLKVRQRARAQAGVEQP